MKKKKKIVCEKPQPKPKRNKYEVARDKFFEKIQKPINVYEECINILMLGDKHFHMELFHIFMSENFINPKTMKPIMDFLPYDGKFHMSDLQGTYFYESVILKRILHTGIQKSIEKNDSSHFRISIEVVREQIQEIQNNTEKDIVMGEEKFELKN
jgi:hypothetical protein